MAKSVRALKATKPKKIRLGRTAQYVADLKHMGEEPVVSGVVMDPPVLQRAFNWYNYMCSRSDAREYIEDYLKAGKRTAELKRLKAVPEAWINLQAGWFARILTRGGVLPQASMDRFSERLQEMYSKAGAEVQSEEQAEVKKPKAEAKVIDIQARIKDKVDDFIAGIEKAIDEDGWTVSVYDRMKATQLPPTLANRVADFYKPICDEAQLLVKKGCDSKLREGYSLYTVAELKLRAAFYESIMSDCSRYAANAKTQRAVQKVVRKKKEVPAEKKLKNLKYQKESKEFKVVSINPEKILGAEELITFNTKYRLLTQFFALDRGGLGVKGTTMTGYDEAKSKSYRLGRKTEEHLETALRGGKRAFVKMLGTLKECGLQHRINENTILLKV